jgi:hypothetical protein
VRIRKESNRARGTHFLESAERRTSENTEEGDKARSIHRLDSEERWTSWDMERKRSSLTSWRAHIDGQMRTWKESERARGTHSLESAARRISEDTE